MSLAQKQILLGISGGIAAYKTATLARLLSKAGATVRVVMTKGGQAFITPLTFQALTGEPVLTELLDPEHEAAMGHIELARWADLIVIAPASANVIARLASGRADDLLTTLCLASDSPLALAPAMNQQMWSQPTTSNNIASLKEQGAIMFGPAEGDQACGDVGPGRMREPEDLFTDIENHFNTGVLAGQKVLITAGPTREPIDPVRFLTNRSSGKMGFAVAQAAVEAGAIVTIVAGPVHQDTPPSVKRIDVETAEEMYQAVMAEAQDSDIFIATAAVGDYRIANQKDHKIKKTEGKLHLDLELNKDILASVAGLEAGPFTVGFAAETRDMEKYARNKLQRKNLNMIAANPVGKGKGFDQAENSLHVYWPNGEQEFPVMHKGKLARHLIDLVSQIKAS